jgi:ABC-type multidrug transport system permease subunit
MILAHKILNVPDISELRSGFDIVYRSRAMNELLIGLGVMALGTAILLYIITRPPRRK